MKKFIIIVAVALFIPLALFGTNYSTQRYVQLVNSLIDSTPIGSVTPSSGVFTTLNAGQPSLYNAYFGGAGNLSNTGQGDTFLGYQAGASNQLASYSTFVGYQSGYSANGGGIYNTFTGAQSGYNTTGYGNSFFGYQAGYSNTSGNGNVMIGSQAGYNWTGSNQFFLNNVKEPTAGADQDYSLLWGTFSGTPSTTTGQQLTVNGSLSINGTLYANGINNYFTGAIHGNADTATQLSSTPSNCGSTGVAYGISANGTALCNNNGAGGVWQSASSSGGCTTSGGSYSTCTISVTWPNAFADTNYVVTCTGLNPSDPRAAMNGIVSQTTTGVTVQFATMGSAAITMGGMNCIAHHL